MRSLHLIALFAVICFSCGSQSGTSIAKAKPLPSPTAVSGHPTLVINLGFNAAPIGLIFAFGSLWVADHHTNNVSRIDPASGQVLAVISSPGGPGDFTASPDALWVSNYNDVGLSRIDPSRNRLSGRVGTGRGGNVCCGLAYGSGSVWALLPDQGVLGRIDATSGEVSQMFSVGEDPFGVLVADGQIWGATAGHLWHVDPSTNQLIATDICCGYPMAYIDQTLWLATDGALVRVSLTPLRVVARIAINGTAPFPVSGDTQKIWLKVGELLISVDPSTNQVVDQLRLPFYGGRVAVANGAVWLTDFDHDKVWRISV